MACSPKPQRASNAFQLMTLVFRGSGGLGHCNVVVSNDLMGGSSYHARCAPLQDHQASSLLTWNGPETRHNEGKEILLGAWKKSRRGHYQTGRENFFLASFGIPHITIIDHSYTSSKEEQTGMEKGFLFSKSNHELGELGAAIKRGYFFTSCSWL